MIPLSSYKIYKKISLLSTGGQDSLCLWGISVSAGYNTSGTELYIARSH